MSSMRKVIEDYQETKFIQTL